MQEINVNNGVPRLLHSSPERGWKTSGFNALRLGISWLLIVLPTLTLNTTTSGILDRDGEAAPRRIETLSRDSIAASKGQSERAPL